MSLTLLANYLVKDFNGDITKAKDIPPFYSDCEAGGKAHRILLWYAKQLSKEQLTFMQIFSLFRRAVNEKDLEGVFRLETESLINKSLRDMTLFLFKRMVDNLCDRRLITKAPHNTFTTHPLIKNYFESIFEEDAKKAAHEIIYYHLNSYAPARLESIEDIQPLLEQAHHGCLADCVDEAFVNIYVMKILCPKENQYQNVLVHKLGAWEASLSFMKCFFPDGDIMRLPLVSDKNAQSWLMNEAGLSLLNLGHPIKAKELYLKKIALNIDDEKWKAASVGYQHLSDLQIHSGEIVAATKSAEKALEYAEMANDTMEKLYSQTYLGNAFGLSGNSKSAEKMFREANKIHRSLRKALNSQLEILIFSNELTLIGTA